MFANIDTESNPFIASGLPSDEMLAEMYRDDARCNAAITPEEIMELEALHGSEITAMANNTPAPAVAPITISIAVEMRGSRFKSGIVIEQAGKRTRRITCPGSFRVEQDAWDAADKLARRYRQSEVTPAISRVA